MSTMQVQVVSPSLNKVHFLFKPVGCKEGTVNGIRKWLKEEEPGLVKRANPLTIGGAVSLILGAVIGLFTSNNGNKGGGFLGSILAIGGIVAGLIGFLAGPNLNVEEEIPPLTAQQGAPPEVGKEPVPDKKDSVIVNESVVDGSKVVTDDPNKPNAVTIQEKDEIKELLDLVQDKKAALEVRKEAIFKLEKSEDKRIVSPLINCLKRKKEHADVRGYAAWALSSRKDPKELERINKTLIQVLSNKKDINKNENNYLKQRVIVALSKVGDDDTLGILKSLQSDPNESQRAYVDFAVSEIEKRYAAN